ncbi:MAG: hypothetical protein ACI9ND_001573, partial [Yoonia sp.]
GQCGICVHLALISPSWGQSSFAHKLTESYQNSPNKGLSG